MIKPKKGCDFDYIANRFVFNTNRCLILVIWLCIGKKDGEKASSSFLDLIIFGSLKNKIFVSTAILKWIDLVKVGSTMLVLWKMPTDTSWNVNNHEKTLNMVFLGIKSLSKITLWFTIILHCSTSKRQYAFVLVR